MKNLLLPVSLILLSACATPNPIPPDIQAAVEKIPIEDLQKYPTLEQQRCGYGKVHFYTLSHRQECKYRIRREKAERKMLQEK